jgi:hypothetical protein
LCSLVRASNTEKCQSMVAWAALRPPASAATGGEDPYSLAPSLCDTGASVPAASAGALGAGG